MISVLGIANLHYDAPLKGTLVQSNLCPCVRTSDACRHGVRLTLATMARSVPTGPPNCRRRIPRLKGRGGDPTSLSFRSLVGSSYWRALQTCVSANVAQRGQVARCAAAGSGIGLPELYAIHVFGTFPPLAASWRMTSLWSQTFIFDEPFVFPE